MDESFWKWYNDVGCLAGDTLVKKTYNSIFEGSRRRGRPQKRWTGAISELCVFSISVEDAREMVLDHVLLVVAGMLLTYKTQCIFCSN